MHHSQPASLSIGTDTDSVSSSTNNLTYVQNEIIENNTKLGGINTSYSDYNLVLGNGTNETTFSLSATNSVNDVISQINNYATANGMNASCSIDENGIISVDGDISSLYISGGIAEAWAKFLKI